MWPTGRPHRDTLTAALHLLERLDYVVKHGRARASPEVVICVFEVALEPSGVALVPSAAARRRPTPHGRALMVFWPRVETERRATRRSELILMTPWTLPAAPRLSGMRQPRRTTPLHAAPRRVRHKLKQTPLRGQEPAWLMTARLDVITVVGRGRHF